MYIDWNEEKNAWLEKNRGITFEMVLEKILNNDIAHPNQKKYAGQYIFIVSFDAYCYVVPYVQTDTGIFLKTIYPDRRVTKKYFGVKDENRR